MLQSPVHLMFALLIVFLNNPADKKTNKPWMKALDIPIYAGIGFVLYYVIANTARLTSRVQYVSPVTLIDKIAMVVCIIILLEAVRSLENISHPYSGSKGPICSSLRN